MNYLYLTSTKNKTSKKKFKLNFIMSDEALNQKRHLNEGKVHSHASKTKKWKPEIGSPVQIHSSLIRKVEKNPPTQSISNTPLVSFQREYKRVIGKKPIRMKNEIHSIEEERTLSSIPEPKIEQIPSSFENLDLWKLKDQVASLKNILHEYFLDADHNNQQILQLSTKIHAVEEEFSSLSSPKSTLLKL